ncbi:bifunctional aspartate transaminase/aspartate 4-decarboxylase [Vibrio splendidus]|uniref:bifunctional aspartate transaminase/aspartate 4-decarboxylase n=1 Tax=Vibrio splendidus TaxID=29497 RepID=UPI001E44469F|nr:bifunctional aspartate transaminase/aspartate 4-decarboxylase [Vibrio splendidus]MCC4861199.1 bifunctional aspartate transaminase/aspartate 4-decarboxylase [Vibrio splendidus]
MKRTDEKRLETLSPFEVKNTLIDLAQHSHEKTMINAGRGNPNWVATAPREAFFQLGMFALEESKSNFSGYEGFGGMGVQQDISLRFLQFCEKYEDQEGVQFLIEAFQFITDQYQVDGDALIYEWVEGILGNNYPVPDRMLKYSELIARKYIEQEMAGSQPLPAGKFDLFAVEGGTAAMVYIFNTLKSNRLLNPGDTIAIGAPIFTPYIEMPELEDYALNKVEIMADEASAWQIPDSELEKLNDPSVRAFFLVNPSNPASVRLSDETLYKIAEVANRRPDLILLTDDVYGTFADNFTSLAMLAPKNTILVYSYSKYFGATGWRLGVIGVHEDNNFDRMIRDLPEDTRSTLSQRYQGIALEPSKIKFIDRLVADSRAVALNHTAGLSTPQQIQMTMFSLLSLMKDGEEYKRLAKQIVRRRYHTLMQKNLAAPIVAEGDQTGAFYYVEIDLKEIAQTIHSNDFFTWLEETYEPLDFLVRLAEEHGVIVMPGAGFDAPTWSLRVSLANLEEAQYANITKAMNAVMQSYVERYEAAC